jgi:hypothetical protein
MYATQTRTKSTLCIAHLRPNESADVGQTLFKLARDRREAVNGRLPCALRLCVAQRVSLVRDDTARRRDCSSIENARDSRSARAMVIHLKASETVRHRVGTGVANDTAQSGPRGRLAALFEKVREFDEPAKRATILTGGRHSEHGGMRAMPSRIQSTFCKDCARPEQLDAPFSTSCGIVTKIAICETFMRCTIGHRAMRITGT